MIEAKIKKKNMLTKNIIQLFLQPLQKFNYKTGDYLTLGFEYGDEKTSKNIDYFKPFSLANAFTENNILELHIRLNNQAESSNWLNKLVNININDKVWINGSFPQYSLDYSNTKKIILVAGGTGFSVIKALLEQLILQKIETKIYFYWGLKSIQDFYMEKWAKNITLNNPNVIFTTVMSDDYSWHGRKGLAHKAVLEDFPNLSDFRVYLCGSWEMQESAKKDFMAAGLPQNSYN